MCDCTFFSTAFSIFFFFLFFCYFIVLLMLMNVWAFEMYKMLIKCTKSIAFWNQIRNCFQNVARIFVRHVDTSLLSKFKPSPDSRFNVVTFTNQNWQRRIRLFQRRIVTADKIPVNKNRQQK